MWIYNPVTGRTELVHDEEHIKRMLDEKCREVPDPRVHALSSQAQPTSIEQVSNASSPEPDEELDSAESGKEAHRRRYIRSAK